MVTVTNFKVVETDEGDTYVRLLLEGDLEMIKSDKTGNFYAHTKRCSISSTFNAIVAEKMIGRQLPGSIVKKEVEPYEFEIDGETLTLTHRWVYTNETPADIAVRELISTSQGNGQASLEMA